MRLLIRRAGKWEEESAEVISWLATHDGSESVAIVDGPPKVFFCGTEELRRTYAESGKQTGTFEELYATLPHPDPAEHPNYCTEGVERSGWLGWAICGWREVCQGKQLYCKGGE